jgi:hypothetical protein
MVAQAKIEVFCWLPPSDHLRQWESNLAVNLFSVHKAIADSGAQMIHWLSQYNLQTFKCKLQSCVACSTLHQELYHISLISRHSQQWTSLYFKRTDSIKLDTSIAIITFWNNLLSSWRVTPGNFSQYCYSSIWYQNLQQKWMLYQNPLLKEFLWSSCVKHPSFS